MNWNDPAFLRSSSALIQWLVIGFATIAVGLQTAKHYIDLREKKITSQTTASKEHAQQEREKELREKLAESQRRIRTLSLQFSVDLSAKWKDGKLPDPSNMLSIGGTKAGSVEVVLNDGRTIPVEFHGDSDHRYTEVGNGITRVSYYTTAAPGSDIYSVLPEEIRAIRALDFGTGLNPSMLDELKVTLRMLDAVFLVNGQVSFAVKIETSTVADMSTPGFRSLQVMWPREIVVKHTESKIPSK